MKTMREAKRALAMTCVALVASFALAGSAFAATVQGADYHGTGSALESGTVDVLNVDGAAGETVFLTVKSGDTVLARNLPYTIGEGAGADDSGSWAGIATLDIDGLNLDALDGSYTIEAYTTRAGGDLLYSGALYGVYADLPDGTTKLIGTRTANASELSARSFDPADTLYVDGRTYRLTGAAANKGGALHFAYQEYNEATTVDGVIKYTDATGNVVATTKIAGLAYGEERAVSVPAVITADNGDLYRTVYFKDSVTAANPGQTSFSVYCTQMSEADRALSGYYLATIKMVDGNGGVIASDSVDVTGEFIYTAPSEIFKTELVDGVPTVVTYKIDGSPTIRLSAANDNVVNRERTVTVSYTAQPIDQAQVNVTFTLNDGSKRVNEDGRILGTQQVVANDDNPTAVPDAEITLDGTTYYLVGDPSDYAYTLHSGAVPSVDAYYLPEGYEREAEEPYDVTVNYVDFLTGSVIESHSYTSDANENARIVIDTPAEFSAGGVDYVRLDGQEAGISHGYYSGVSTYTVYYRDVNDTLSSGVVINTIRVTYVDGTTAGGDATGDGAVDGAAGDGADGADGAAADGDGVTALQLNAGRVYSVLDGAGSNSTLRNEEGVDSNTERIEDSETPLSSGFNQGGSSSAASSFLSSASWVVPAVLGIAVVIIGLLAFLARQRRKNDDMYEM